MWQHKTSFYATENQLNPMLTCPEVLQRHEGQASTVALSISTILYKTKTRQPGITILSNARKTTPAWEANNKTYKYISNDLTWLKRTLYALKSWYSACPLLLQYSNNLKQYYSYSHCPTHGLCHMQYTIIISTPIHLLLKNTGAVIQHILPCQFKYRDINIAVDQMESNDLVLDSLLR